MALVWWIDGFVVCVKRESGVHEMRGSRRQ